jgi:hypothetical protein
MLPTDAPACLSPFSISAATVAGFFGPLALISKGRKMIRLTSQLTKNDSGF